MKIFKLAVVLFVLLVGSNMLFAQQIASGKFSFNSAMPNYTLDKQSGQRSMTLDISFEKGFDKKPQVMIGVNLLDAGTQSNIRYNVEALSISEMSN